jgi:hypothetical protein
MPGQRPWAFAFFDSNDRNIIITDNILQNLVSTLTILARIWSPH